MTTRRFASFLVCAVLHTAIFGCASFDRIGATKFEPIRTEAGAQVFKFTAFADSVYPLKSEDAERTRIDWLETWLKDNGYDPKKYEVISRVPVLRNKGLLGDIYDIFYEVRVAK
jgi:hypothetical protein